MWVIDVITGTGMRPHETFALLLDEIDVQVGDPYLDVTGTLIEVRGEGRGGWERKPVPKTDNSWRRILLPPHSVEAVNETITELKASGRPNPMGLLFPSRVETPRSPTNFGRVWRAARGTEFSWVTPRTFRRGAGTEVDRVYGDPGRAVRQLGNTEAVAKKHYIDIPQTAPDTGTCSNDGPPAGKEAKV
ncbi:hypothetical protein ACQP0C_27460 [Nocardia sp. CA-129566]|uniref:hypothetical protein n=1 Tax=Nocardia sp. CA-129566 TaxID=3239976 RepID=UPI003D98F73E